MGLRSGTPFVAVLLCPLADDGGPTGTHALPPGYAAIACARTRN
jgi:hypothetical protein